MRALDRKLLRDLWRLRGQVVTIALVVASGIATFVAMRSAWSSLSISRTAYETQYVFADVFGHVERAPREVVGRLEQIPGVALVVPRLLARVSLPIESMAEPATGRVISLPDGENAPLNALYLRAGRLPDPDHPDEVVLIASFAEFHGIRVGETIPALLNGKLRQLDVVGLGLSPEFVFPMAEGEIAPDDERFAVIWMSESAVAPLFDMQGAFNDVVFDLQPGASEPAVIEAIDRELDPWGGTGSYGRSKQLSAHAVDSEMSQLESFATVVPGIFLAVAAFLLNVVLSRLIQLQRPQIAALKALGYRNREVGLHYFWMMMVVVLLGAVVGLLVGSWLGSAMTALYAKFYRFPILVFRLDAAVVFASIAISAGAALVGAATAVRAAVSLPPAEAMRPESPGNYRRSLSDLFGISPLVGTSMRMVLREMMRRPLRFGFSVLGIAMAGAILVVGRFSTDAFTYMLDLQFGLSWREDVVVMLARPVPAETVAEMDRLPGVMAAEGLRAVPVRLSHAQRDREVVLYLTPDDLTLRELWDIDRVHHKVADGGLTITGALGRALRLEPGDFVDVEILDGDRERVRVPVAAVVEEPFGLQAYIDADEGRALLDEPPLANTALLRVEPAFDAEIDRRLQDMPAVLTTTRKQAMLDRFNAQMGEMMLTMTLILTLFAATIAVGVVYNNARIALSMRSRDLASLRVLGFRRDEIAMMFYGEMAAQVVLAIPLGIWLGSMMSRGLAATVDPEIFRFPTYISPATYLFSGGVLVGSGVLSAWLVRGRLRNLDLIGVLKARE